MSFNKMDRSGLRNLKDFLLQYNKISQSCFLQCVNNFSDRDLSQDECGCVDMCTKKHIHVNHKVMQIYMEVQPQIVNKRVEEMNKEKAALEEVRKKELETSNVSKISESVKEKVENVSPSGNLINSKEDINDSDKDIIMRTGDN